MYQALEKGWGAKPDFVLWVPAHILSTLLILVASPLDVAKMLPNNFSSYNFKVMDNNSDITHINEKDSIYEQQCLILTNIHQSNDKMGSGFSTNSSQVPVSSGRLANL